MKKLYLLIVLIFSVQVIVSGQSSPSNTERYGVDFMIKGWTKIDTAALMQIDMTQYEHLRKDILDVEHFASDLNLTLVLFSKLKTIENEGKQKTVSTYFRDLYFKD